jgi:hypothetical protein
MKNISTGTGIAPSRQRGLRSLREATSFHSADSLPGDFSCDGRGRLCVVMSVSKQMCISTVLATVACISADASPVDRPSGIVVGWGANEWGQSDVPADLGAVVDVATGGTWTLALRPDGSVRGWGNNESGALSVPSSLLPADQVIGGGGNSGIHRADGCTHLVGRGCGQGTTNLYGCTGPVDVGNGWCFANNQVSTPYVGTTICGGGGPNLSSYGGNFRDLGLGVGHVIALTMNGAVQCAGDNYFGQVSIPPGLSSVVDVDAGGYVSAAVTESGLVRCWGYNSHGQCNVPPTAIGVVEIAISSEHCVARCADGRVVCWGSNQYGQCNVPTGVGAAIKIAADDRSSVAIFASSDADGDGIAFGTDNCPGISNPSQADCDSDGIGDACELDHDCNANAIPDNCEISSGTTTDYDRNGIPDACQCLADLFFDHQVNGADLGILLSQWGPANGGTISDINHDGIVNGADLGYLLNAWGPCPN